MLPTINVTRIEITNTSSDMSPRELIRKVVGEKLGIPRDKVADNAAIGKAISEIVYVLCFKLGEAFIATPETTIDDLVLQLSAP